MKTRRERGDHPHLLAHDARLCAKLIVAGNCVPTLDGLREIYKLSNSQGGGAANALVMATMCKGECVLIFYGIM